RPTSDYFRLKDIGNGILRNSLANSDTLFMIALQMASKKQIGRFASIIQLVNMSLYRGMGLNHALVSTPAVREFIDLAQKGESSKETLIESLEKAVKSYKAAQNEARAGMPTIHILHYWMMKASPLQKSIAVFFMLMTGIPGCKADGITSHPKMYPGNRTVGRPGIYIPYLSMFGLHYLIHENDIDLMFMPGKGTNLDLKSFSEDIRESLMLLKNLVPKVQVADERASQRAPDFYAT
ncbi:MAG: choline/carnitine O-acyltransferase, partial [Pseudobdellovibrionaceae bacterium]